MRYPIQVTFDSNVWENLIEPDIKPNTLKDYILANKIEPYITEIALSLESLERVRRKNFFESYEPSFEFYELTSVGGKIHSRMCIKPDTSVHYGLHPRLKRKLEHAQELNFRVLPMTNLGTVRSDEVPKSMMVDFLNTDVFWQYAERLAKCSYYIQGLNCGSYQYLEYRKMCLNHDAKCREIKQKNFSKLVAEWVDGDSLAAHYAYGNLIFCTEDRAQGAGVKSIFNKKNLSLVCSEFEIQVMTIEELVSFVDRN